MGIRAAIIKTGIDNGSNVEVLSGLKEGEEVIISMNTSATKATAARTDNGPRGPFPF